MKTKHDLTYIELAIVEAVADGDYSDPDKTIGELDEEIAHDCATSVRTVRRRRLRLFPVGSRPWSGELWPADLVAFAPDDPEPVEDMTPDEAVEAADLPGDPDACAVCDGTGFVNRSGDAADLCAACGLDTIEVPLADSGEFLPDALADSTSTNDALASTFNGRDTVVEVGGEEVGGVAVGTQLADLFAPLEEPSEREQRFATTITLEQPLAFEEDAVAHEGESPCPVCDDRWFLRSLDDDPFTTTIHCPRSPEDASSVHHISAAQAERMIEAALGGVEVVVWTRHDGRPVALSFGEHTEDDKPRELFVVEGGFSVEAREPTPGDANELDNTNDTGEEPARGDLSTDTTTARKEDDMTEQTTTPDEPTNPFKPQSMPGGETFLTNPTTREMQAAIDDHKRFELLPLERRRIVSDARHCLKDGLLRVHHALDAVTIKRQQPHINGDGVNEFGKITISLTPYGKTLSHTSILQALTVYSQIRATPEEIADMIADDLWVSCRPEKVVVTYEHNVSGATIRAKATRKIDED